MDVKQVNRGRLIRVESTRSQCEAPFQRVPIQRLECPAHSRPG